jgi:hypothetical protein
MTSFWGEGDIVSEKLSLEDDLMHYENKWVAISESEDKVVGSGIDAYEAKLDAEKNGYEDTILFKVRPFGRTYTLSTT